MTRVVIIAGGKGTRIASVASEIPKAMIPVCGKPVLERQIEMACRQGFTEITLLIGHLGDLIKDYFGDGSQWGVHIDYYHERTPLGTAGALAEIRHLLTEDYFVFYGDTVMDIDMACMLEFHRQRHADATLYLHPNDHPYDSDLVVTSPDGRVTSFLHKPHPEGSVYHNLVNAALFIFSPRVTETIARGVKSHIEKDILPRCLDRGMRLYGYVSTEYVKDMGTPQRYEQVTEDWRSGRVESMRRTNKRKAIFLDRDGVLNEDCGLVYQPGQVSLIEGVAESLQLIHRHGFLAVVVTNQSVIARNLCSFEELDIINQTLETLLGKKNAYIDALYYCPHHPDGGYPEERKEYKVSCSCRKPAPGLLLKAAEDLNIDLSQSVMIGDRESDSEAGVRAGVRASILIPTNHPGALQETLLNYFANI